MTVKTIITEDQSMSLFHGELNETYHSTHGAITESMLVFIQNGLIPLLSVDKNLNIFEMGFGTGLNALLTLKSAPETSIYYKTIEAYPLSMDVIHQLNYTFLPGFDNYRDAFNSMHSSNWQEDVRLNNFFTLHKIKSDIRDFKVEKERYDLIYFDAFSPNVQPELWTTEVFFKMFESLKPEGVLVTYSSKGIVKQALRGTGFIVERLPGPPGKRHIVRAVRKC